LAIAQFYGPSKVQAAAAASLDGFYFNAANSVLGPWSSQVMNALLITSLFACILSFHNTLNRYFFALGREGMAAKVLGSVHTKHGSPYAAGLLQSLIAAIILALFVIFGADPYTVVFSWMAALAGIGILLVQVLVCVAIVMFFRKTPNSYSAWTTTIAPVLALLGLVVSIMLVGSNLSLLSGSDSLVVKAFPYAMVLVGILGALFAIQVKKSKPDLYASLGKVFE
jgi:amino acid transporter